MTKYAVQPSTSPVSFQVHPEAIRQAAYLAFWGMVGFAVVCTKTWVEIDMNETVLMKTFGFNNICVNWDYSPAREYTSLVYPLFEYLFLLYIVISFLQIMAQYKMGTLPRWLYITSCVTLPFQVVFVAWFRMIFVYKVTDDAVGHTLGFFGMQITLCLVAMQNILYSTAYGTAYPMLGRKGTLIVCWMTFALLVPITMYKITWASAIFAGKPILDLNNPTERLFIKTMDRVWMALAAVWPLIDAEMQRRSEPPITITVSSGAEPKIGTTELGD